MTRGVIMKLCQSSFIPIAEKRLERHDLYVADECFLTGTAAEVIPVTKIDGRVIGSGDAGPVTKKLLEAFHKFVRLVDAAVVLVEVLVALGLADPLAHDLPGRLGGDATEVHRLLHAVHLALDLARGAVHAHLDDRLLAEALARRRAEALLDRAEHDLLVDAAVAVHHVGESDDVGGVHGACLGGCGGRYAARSILVRPRRRETSGSCQARPRGPHTKAGGLQARPFRVHSGNGAL